MTRRNYDITPTTPDDVREFFPKASPWRIRAWTVRVDGKIKGIGGIAILPDGSRLGFMEAKEEDIKEHPVILLRATKKFFADIEERGIRRLSVTCDTAREAAARWLAHIGFEPVGVFNGEQIWSWRAFSQR